jgi:galactokinase
VPRDRVVAFGPGRVNVIGEHTDYNDGLSLPFAIAQGVTVTADARDDGVIEAVATDVGETDRFALDAIEPSDEWRAFVRGVAAELRAAGLPVRGARLEFTGDVPEGAGLSSSAALEVGLCLALLGLSDAEDALSRIELAKLCSRVENEWVGAQTGLLDQLASLHGDAGAAVRIDFRSLDVRRVPFDLGDWRLVTLDSGESHSLAASGYNERRAECTEAAERLGVTSLRDATAEGAAALPEPLGRRVRHVLEENARVDRAVEALAAEELTELGRLLDASHASLRDLYEASTPAVEATVERLRAGGAVGARMVGGGFGGHVLALLPPGVEPPDGALAVEPGAGARLIGA